MLYFCPHPLSCRRRARSAAPPPPAALLSPGRGASLPPSQLRVRGGRGPAEGRARARQSNGDSAAAGGWVLQCAALGQCRSCWSAAGLCASLRRGSPRRAAPCPHRSLRCPAARLGGSLRAAARHVVDSNSCQARAGRPVPARLWCEGSPCCRF